MYVWKGQAVSSGITSGKITYYKRKQRQISKLHTEDCNKEQVRFAEAVALAKGQLQTLYEQSISSIGQQDALIFGIHQMLLEDEEFQSTVLAIIEEDKVCAEYAVFEAAGKIEEHFRKQERSEDIWDVAECLLRILAGDEFDEMFPLAQGIVIAEELLPSEVMKLDVSKVNGIVLKKGSVNSHTAILLKSRMIPAMICPTLTDIAEGTEVLLDAGEGICYTEPDAETIDRMNQKRIVELAKQTELLRLKNAKTRVRLCANVAGMEDVTDALANGADGIGLVRSEMFCVKEQSILSEEKQFQIYKEILQKMGGKKVVIRTWDFGEDKVIDGLDTQGLRGIRFCLERATLFREQLRALCRASVYGNLSILIPMISSVDEIKQVKKILDGVKHELSKEGKAYDKNILLGAMIETPAAVIVSRQLAREVDFFSIGTNDLTQYTLGVARNQDSYDPYHPAVMELIRMTVKNGHAEGIPVGICGEAGADESLTKTFVTMGIDELSVAPSKLLTIRKELHLLG